MNAPASTPLTPVILKGILEATFPGAYIDHSAKIGGVSFTLKIWQFEINVALNVIKVAHVDNRGELRFTFSYHPAEGNKTITSSKVTIKQGVTTKEEEFREMLSWVEKYLRGVSAAIETSFEPLENQVKTSIFDDD